MNEKKEKKLSRRKKQQLMKQKRTKKKIILAIESVVIVLLVAFVSIFGYMNHLLGKTNYKDIAFGSIGVNANVAESKEQKDEGKKGKEFIALVGLDTRDTTDEDTGEEYSDSMNSDTMIIACIDHDAKKINMVSLYRDTYLNVFYNNGNGVEGYDDYYYKANNAYAQGGATQFLTMLNKNLDLNITEYVTVNFVVLSHVIDDLGGLDIAMTREEAIHMNNHNIETSKAVGVDPVPVELPPQEEFDGAQLHTFHLTGTQAVAYSRIRQTEGNDMKRASRQRDVIDLIMQKAKGAGLTTVLNIANTVLPEVETSLDSTQIVNLATQLLGYDMGEQTGFPFAGQYTIGEDVRAVLPKGLDALLPVTLESNVKQLHEFFWPGEAYTPSAEVTSYSDYIANLTGFYEGSLDGAVVDEGTPETQSQSTGDTTDSGDTSAPSDDGSISE